jgi:hypothetical protein
VEDDTIIATIKQSEYLKLSCNFITAQSTFSGRISALFPPCFQKMSSTVVTLISLCLSLVCICTIGPSSIEPSSIIQQQSPPPQHPPEIDELYSTLRDYIIAGLRGPANERVNVHIAVSFLEAWIEADAAHTLMKVPGVASSLPTDPPSYIGAPASSLFASAAPTSTATTLNVVSNYAASLNAMSTPAASASSSSSASSSASSSSSPSSSPSSASSSLDPAYLPQLAADRDPELMSMLARSAFRLGKETLQLQSQISQHTRNILQLLAHIQACVLTVGKNGSKQQPPNKIARHIFKSSCIFSRRTNKHVLSQLSGQQFLSLSLCISKKPLGTHSCATTACSFLLTPMGLESNTHHKQHPISPPPRAPHIQSPAIAQQHAQACAHAQQNGQQPPPHPAQAQQSQMQVWRWLCSCV